MSRTVIALLVVTNLATGYQAWVYHQRYQAAVSNKTTDRERDSYGIACLEFLNKKAKERGYFFDLGRSWKKHGQMVFEIMPATDKDWTTARETLPNGASPVILCTYDKQSGLMVPIVGEEQERWMFYE